MRGRLLPIVFLLLQMVLVDLAASGAAMLTCPRKLYSGSRSSATVTTFDAATRIPTDRSVTLYLVSLDGAEKLFLSSGQTGTAGTWTAHFDVPAGRSGMYTVRAEVAGLSEVLEVSTMLAEGHAILIETDKPIYKPGQKIQGRVILLNNNIKPVPGSVEVTFLDGKGLRIARFPLTADEYGVAPFSLDLATELNYGVWKIRARSTSGSSERDLRVEPYVLPRFEVKLDLPKSWVLVDEPLKGTVEAGYFFGQPVQGTVQLTARRWVGTWEKYATASGSLADGAFQFDLPPANFVAGTAADGGQGSVTLELSVVDSTGNEQSLTDVVKVVQAPVILSIIPSQDSLTPGVELPVLIRAESPDGSPAAASISAAVVYRGSDGTVLKQETWNLPAAGGSTTMNLSPPAKTSLAEVRVETTVQKHKTTTERTIGAAYSPTGHFLSLTRVSGDGPATLGQTLTFSAAGFSGSTLYYEVYAGGRTVLSAAASQTVFSFPVTPEMIPKARVVGYVIMDNNEVAADSVDFDVNLALSLTAKAEFAGSEIKPGDPVKLTIDAGTGRRTMLGLSLVDQSVLALGRSRLHMAEVFGELEREFMQPQVEVHEGEDPGPVFMPSYRVKGALDVLREAGLEVDVSAGITVPAGQDFPLWWKGGVVIPVSPPAFDSETTAGAPEAPRVRQFFPETWLWRPALLTDDTGKVTLDLIAPDSITSWKLSIVGTTPGGPAGQPGIVMGEAEAVVFQDFFVEPSLPYSVTRGEKFKVKVDVFNYLNQAQDFELRFEAPSGLELLSSSRQTVTVPANGAVAAYFEVRPTALGNLDFTVTGIGASRSDAVLRRIKVVPEGLPVDQVQNGVIAAGQKVTLSVTAPPLITPEIITADSHSAILFLTPSPVGQSMHGVSDLLGMPYGCGEQNMIFLAPDVEILRYLNEIGELAAEIRAKAEYYINVGYQRELTFQTDDGGFAAFGGEEGSLWLTAFVLSTFSAAREVRDIDETVLAKAAEMLKSRQEPDGSFRTDDFLIHQEMAGGLADLFSMTAFTANALADYGQSASPAVLNRAGGYLQANSAAVWQDSYSLAIAAVALQKIPGFEALAEQIIDQLLKLAVRDDVGIHWEPYPVETTAYATIALIHSRNGAGRPEASPAVEWLSTQRNALGGYGHSTQDTVTALRAMFLAARKVQRAVALDVTVLDAGKPVFTTHVDQSNFDLLQQFPLPTGRELVLQAAGTGSVAYQLANRFYAAPGTEPEQRDMELDVTYATDHVEADQTVDVGVRVNYTGKKEKTGMVILDVSVPTGFEAVSASLQSLVSSGKVQKVEQAGRKVVFYIDGLLRDQPLVFGFQVRALYPVRTDPAVSKAYEYYDSSVFAYGRTSVRKLMRRPRRQSRGQ
ncbi:MAG: alpha-2-macroglobulin family protein [Acidobacteriota bacterium]